VGEKNRVENVIRQKVTRRRKEGKKSVQRRKNVLSGTILLLQNEYERRVFVNIILNVVVDEMV
jgi:hypothetical protein